MTELLEAEKAHLAQLLEAIQRLFKLTALLQPVHFYLPITALCFAPSVSS